MKRIRPTRGVSLALVMGAALVCAGVAGGQQRRGGGGHSSYPSGGSYRGGSAPSYHQQAPGYRHMMPQQGYRPVPQGGAQGYRGYPGSYGRYGSGQQGYGRPQTMSGERYGQEQNPAPVERRQPNQQQYSGRQPNQQQYSGQPQGYAGRLPQAGSAPGRQNQRPENHIAENQGGPHGEHLAQWMNQHRNLSPQQQQQALQHEPGFSQLPRQTQDRMRNRLAQLNAMPPERRERILAYNERMEHLSVNQRTEVRNSLQQLGGLPLDQRRQVAQAWRNLRDLPPNQQAAVLNSPQYQYMNPVQRSTLNNLLRVSPLLPPPEEQQPR